MQLQLDEFLDAIIKEALEICESEEIIIYTFAMYFDELNNTISVCFDTKDNSTEILNSNKTRHSKYFHDALKKEDLDSMTKYSLSENRNLSLGDFELVDVCRTEIEISEINTNKLYLSMINAINRNRLDIIEMSNDVSELALCCSGPLDDTQFVWQALS